jgi:hypothetical protein
MHKTGAMIPPDKAFRLHGQFILGTTGTCVPEGWLMERAGSWILGRHPSLPAIRLLAEKDRFAGWFIGYPIDGNGRLIAEGDVLRFPGLVDGTEPDLETFIYGFGGRFLAALVGAGQPRLYLDPVGSLSVVYCAHQGIVASTPNLVPYDYRTRDRVRLARALRIPDSSAMYPLGMTPRFNVERLLPNHYLDLSNWKSVRHWPKEPLRSEGSVAEAVSAIAAVTKRNIAAVVARNPTYLRLTAGQDSRMLLACARDVADRLELFTVPIPDDGAYIDVAIARKIARRFHMRHFVPRFQEPNRKDLEEWTFRTGCSTGEMRGWRAVTMFKQANPAYAQLDGAVGGLERIGEILNPGESMSSQIIPERLIQRCLAPRTGPVLSIFQSWLSTVPADNAFHVLDLFEIEQRLGCWGGIWPYAEGGNPGFILFPMCHREVIERMITLPPEYRLSGALMKDVIDSEWPELLAWPFNRPIGFMRAFLAARRARRSLSHRSKRIGNAIRNPEMAADRIRQRLSQSSA